jgi:hypothetical protein
MKTQHFIKIELNINASKERIIHLLDRAQELGFIFFDNVPLLKGVQAPIIDSRTAYQKLIRRGINEDNDEEHILMKFEDTYFNFYCSPDTNNLLTFCITEIVNIWKKEYLEFSYEYLSIDLSRYIEILLKMSDDFVVNSCNVMTFS